MNRIYFRKSKLINNAYISGNVYIIFRSKNIYRNYNATYFAKGFGIPKTYRVGFNSLFHTL